MRFNSAELIHGLRHLLPVSLLLLAACSSGGGGDTPPPATTYSIGGSVSGLSGTVVLQNNGGNNLSVSANGPFTFSTKLADGAAYTVTVLTQPAGQICTASSNTGTVAGANVTSVAVTCAPISTATYSVGGNITGLTGTGLVLQNNASDNLSVNINGSFTFSTAVADGAGYAVTVLTQPAGQTCTVTSGNGTISGANVSSVAVNCTAVTYSVSASVTGLIGTVQLYNNGGDLYTVTTSPATITFFTRLPDGATYNVTALVTAGGQTCTPSNNAGIISGQNVTVTVTCSTNTWTIGGTTPSGGISGLIGSVTLLNNGADPLTLSAPVPGPDFNFVFASPISQGSGYDVTVSAQPANQLCTVTNGTGFNVAANITTVKVTCVNTYTVGGTIVSVSAPGGGPTLQNNGGDTLVVGTISTAPGTAFTFSTPIADGSTYAVSQLNRAFAPTQDCAVTGGGNGLGGGTVTGGNVTSVVVTCTAVSPIPKFAYVTNSTANTVSAYTVTYATGALTTAGAAVTTGLQPNAVAVAPSGSFAYVVNYGADTVSGYSINATTGVLTRIDINGTLFGNDSGTGGDGPVAISIHPSGLYAYVVNQGVTGLTGADTLTVFSIDPATGALAVIDASSAFGQQDLIGTDAKPNAVAIDSAGRFLYVTNATGATVSAYTIDQTNGALTSLGTVATGTEPASVSIDPNGRCALVANAGSDSVSSYAINQTTGALTAVGTVTAAVGTVTTPRSVAIDPSGLYAYTANAGTHDVSAYSLAPSTCAIAAINADAVGAALTIPAGQTPISVSIDPSGTYVYVVNFVDSSVSTYSIDPTGALTVAGTATATGAGPTSFATAQ